MSLNQLFKYSYTPYRPIVIAKKIYREIFTDLRHESMVSRVLSVSLYTGVTLLKMHVIFYFT